jgi:hypothetical protein
MRTAERTRFGLSVSVWRLLLAIVFAVCKIGHLKGTECIDFTALFEKFADPL